MYRIHNLYVKGCQDMMQLCHEELFFLFTNSADPDEMPHYVAFHLGPRCFAKKVNPCYAGRSNKFFYRFRHLFERCSQF